MIMLFSLKAENNFSYSPKFSYRYHFPGLASPFVSSPVGFSRAYHQPYHPVSINFPEIFSMIKLKESTSADGDLLLISEKIGDKDLGIPQYMSFQDYFQTKIRFNRDMLWYRDVAMTDASYFIDPVSETTGGQSLEIIGADIAGQRVALRIRGLISITGKYNQQNNSIMATGNMDTEQRNFLMDQTQQFTIEGTIGDRITISIDEDSERDFEFENAIKIDYKGKPDEIVQSANFGNIRLSLPGTQFITGSASSSGLFGGKADLKLGPINMTAIASYEKKDSKKKAWGGSADGGGSVVQIFDYEYKRNVYFFVDGFFRSNMYPYDLQTGKFTYTDMIEDYDVYISTNERDDSRIRAVAFVELSADGTPSIVTSRPEEDIADSIYFRKLTKSTTEQFGEYDINPYQGYIRLNIGLSDNHILAIAYRTSSGKRYGDLANGRYLKIIKAENPKPNYQTWDLEMKNVYDLKARNIDKQGFDLKIFYNGSNQPVELVDGVPYLRYFNLDNYDQNGTPGNDGKIDVVPEKLVVDLSRGELWMPYILPFQAPPEDNTTEGIYNNNLSSSDDDKLPSAEKIYTSSYNDPERLVRKYYIEVQYANRSSTIELGEMFIIEGSEEILVNGKKMSRGIDYDIDYFSGTITLKSAEALNKNAKIDINYETEQLFGGIGEQKLLAGLRAEYRISEKAFLGATMMYYSRNVLDNKNVNIGDEPFKNFIWDVNGEFEYDLNWLDRAMNALPMIHVKQASSVKFVGEVAQILPNPNTIENKESGDFDGVAKLDDFESASQKSPMNLNFQRWTHASKPNNNFFGASFPERGFMFWYNPFYVDRSGGKVFGIYTKHIWPQKETTETDQYTNVLNVVLDPEVNGITGNSTMHDARQIWGGIMQPVYMYDQSKSKYIEVWVRGERGQLQIDIGEITEDWYNENYNPAFPHTEFGDGKLQTEDRNNNGILDISTGYNEDTGINGLTDEEEIMRGWNPIIDNFDKEGYKRGEVRYVNGTQGNAGNDGIQPYPDTEDIDRDGKLDQANNYYSYTLDLSSDQWLASRTYFTGGEPTGWKQYRIPLTAMIDSVGLPNFMSIRTMRLSMFGVEKQDTLQFASISIVGNEWQEAGIASGDQPFYIPDDDRFFITVKNTDEDADYVSPPGVSGREMLNTIGGSTIREKEQALVMNFEGLKPGETAMAEKIMLDSKTLLMYRKLKMFIHGNVYDSPTESSVNLFLRIGRGDMSEYYEAVTEVYPGWDNRNHIEMVFDIITSLKIHTEFDNDQYFIYDDGRVREYRPKENGEYTGKIFRVVGNPTLSRIEKMQLGVVNIDNFRDYTGEIWVNEMRVVETNNDPGMAMRGSFDLRLGGLISFNANARKTDADFHQVNQQMSTGQSTVEAYNLMMTVRANKLLPEKWKIDLPVNISQTRSISTPKYYPGSDILMTSDPNDSLKSISKTQSISSSFRRTGTADDPLLTRFLINPVQANISAANTQNSSLEILDQRRRTFNSSLSYSVSFKRDNGINYLSWIPFLNEKTRNKKFYWKPSSFSWNMNVAETEDERITRSTQDTISSYAFTLTKNMSFAYDPFDALKLSYARSSNSDLRDYRYDTWRIFTDMTYDSLMNGVNVGNVLRMNENLNIAFNPDITNWLKPRFSYGTTYNYNTQSNWNYANVSMNRRFSGSLTLSLKQIWDEYDKKFKENKKRKEAEQKKDEPINTPPPPKKTVAREDDGRPAPKTSEPRPGERPQEQPQDKTQEKAPGLSLNIRIPWEKFTIPKLLDKIDPVRMNFSETFTRANSGVSGDDTLKIYKNVHYKYRYGLGEFIYLPTNAFEGSVTGPLSNTLQRSMGISSGLKLTPSLSMRLEYKQNTNTGRQYQFKTTSGEYFDEIIHIIAFEDTLELLPYDSSATRSFLPIGDTGKEGFVFPEYSLQWQINPGQYAWTKGKLDFIRRINLQHQMSSSESVRYRFNKQTDQYYLREESSTYTISFNPLIRAGFVFTGNLRMDIGFNKTMRTENRGDVEYDFINSSITRTFQDNMTLSVSYSYNKGLNIPVPFLKNIETLQLQNELTFSLQGRYGLDKRIVKPSGHMTFGEPTNFRVNWEIEPQVSYRFSRNIDGRLFFKYGQRIDRTQEVDGKNKMDDYKDFGVTVTIRISG
jgi:cell surface protein SprA